MVQDTHKALCCFASEMHAAVVAKRARMRWCVARMSALSRTHGCRRST